MKHIMIVNSTLQSKKLEKFLNKATEAFQQHHLDYQIFIAHSIEERYHFLTSLECKARIYIIGGDGTLHRSLPAFVNTHHELVLIPFGTGNDFVRMLIHKKKSLETIHRIYISKGKTYRYFKNQPNLLY